MRTFSFYLLFLLLMASTWVEGKNCSQEALRALLEQQVTGSAPATFHEFKVAEDAYLRPPDGIPPYVLHLRGEIRYVPQGPIPGPKLDSGLHTNEALDLFKRLRPDLADEINTRVMANGVQVVELPREAFTGKRLKILPLQSRIVDGREIIFSQKTVFPKDWSEQDVIRAIEDVKANRASFTEVKKNATFVTGIYNGVRIRIVMQEGEVKTAYPLAE